MAVIGAANPAAGVMATRPATAPVIAPSSDGLPLATRSTSVHDTAAAAVATKVLTKATAATPLASRLEPALKPNQPTHSSAAPTIDSVSECGGIGSRGKPRRLPTMMQPTSPATPALMCTTVPPAKSRAPQPQIRPMSAGASFRKSGPGQYQTKTGRAHV